MIILVIVAYVLEIETPSQVLRDPLFGNIFENLVVVEVLKQRYNRGYDADLYFFRDSNGNEIDLLCKTSDGLVGIEIKAASTWHGKFAKQLVSFATNNHTLCKSLVVYNGAGLQLSNGVNATPYNQLSHALEL